MAPASGVFRKLAGEDRSSCLRKLSRSGCPKDPCFTTGKRGSLPVDHTPGPGSVRDVIPRLHLASSPAGAAAVASSTVPVRVVLADAHALMRRSLRLLLDGEKDVEVIAEASDLDSAVRHVQGD